MIRLTQQTECAAASPLNKKVVRREEKGRLIGYTDLDTESEVGIGIRKVFFKQNRADFHIEINGLQSDEYTRENNLFVFPFDLDLTDAVKMVWYDLV